MLNEAFNQLEIASVTLSFHSLLGMGISFTLCGLVIWLSGLALTRIAACTVGGFAGCVAAYVLFNSSTQIIGAGIIVGVLVGVIFELLISSLLGFGNFGYNFSMAITTAFSGTIMIFIGMILLLSLKGAQPIPYISGRQNFFLSVIFAMVTFATIEQLIFCKKAFKTKVRTISSKPKLEIDPVDKEDWRNK